MQRSCRRGEASAPPPRPRHPRCHLRPPSGAAPFPPTVLGLATRVCPVLSLTVVRGTLEACEANDVFKANIAASILDDDSVFDVVERLFDAHDVPLFYDALSQLYAGSSTVEPVLAFSADVQHNVGWLAYEAKPATTRVRIRLELADDGATATYALCMLPVKLANAAPEPPNENRWIASR